MAAAVADKLANADRSGLFWESESEDHKKTEFSAILASRNELSFYN